MVPLVTKNEHMKMFTSNSKIKERLSHVRKNLTQQTFYVQEYFNIKIVPIYDMFACLFVPFYDMFAFVHVSVIVPVVLLLWSLFCT